MSDFPTQADLFRRGRDEILAKNTRLRRDIVEREGTDANALVSVAAAIGDEVILHLARICSAQFIDSARGQYLRRLVFDRYGISAKGASPSFGTVGFTTTVLTTAPFTIAAGTRLQTNDGRQFMTLADVVFPQNSLGPVYASVRSVQAGLAQQAKAGTITSILSTITNAPATLAVTNALATSGGMDAEEDDDLRARAKAFFSNARRGTLSALREAALGVLGVKRANTFEGLDEFGRPALRVKLVITDQFTEALVSTTSNTYAAQSQALADAVYEALEEYRAGGVFVDVIVAQVILQSVLLSLSFEADTDIDTAALRARAAAVAYVNNLSPGASFVPADLVEALRLVPGLIVTGNEVVSPAGTVVPEQLQVLRTSLAMVSTISLNPNRVLQSTRNSDSV